MSNESLVNTFVIKTLKGTTIENIREKIFKKAPTPSKVNTPETTSKRKSATKTKKNITVHSSPEKKTPKPRHLVIGHKLPGESGWSFCYSETETLREILVDFAKTVDTSTNKSDSILFADTLSTLSGNTGIRTAFLLMEKIFSYKIDFIGEISKLYRGKDFIDSLTRKRESNNGPLPF